MQKGELVRCINIKTGNVRYLVPAVANSPARLKRLGFMRAAVEAPPVTIKQQDNGIERNS